MNECKSKQTPPLPFVYFGKPRQLLQSTLVVFVMVTAELIH